MHDQDGVQQRNSTGLQLTEALAVKLSSFDPKEIFGSEEPKASETATIIGDTSGVPV